MLPARKIDWGFHLRSRWRQCLRLLASILAITAIVVMIGIKIAAITSIFNAFIHGGLSPLPVHVVLIAGAILAEAAVARGIVLESPPPEKRTTREKRGIRLVLWGVVLSASFTILLFVFDEGISNTQQSTIITLLRHGLARSIDVSAFTKHLSGVPPAEAEIRYVVDCGDCETLSFELLDALHRAHWSVNPPIPIVGADWVNAVTSLRAQSTGISVVISSPDKITGDPKKPLGALMDALGQALGFGFNGYDTSDLGGVDPRMSPDVIRIVIAPKA